MQSKEAISSSPYSRKHTTPAAHTKQTMKTAQGLTDEAQQSAGESKVQSLTVFLPAVHQFANNQKQSECAGKLCIHLHSDNEICSWTAHSAVGVQGKGNTSWKIHKGTSELQGCYIGERKQVNAT